MKLALVIPSLTAGGAERVMSIMANHWAAKGWGICLLSLDDGAAPPFFPLDGRVRHRTLALLADSANPLTAVRNNLKRLRVLRRVIREENPDAVISFLDSTNVLTLLATRGLGRPVIVSEHIDPGRYRIKPMWNLLRRWVYPFADRVVVLTERVLEFFPASLRPRLEVIPNPVLKPASGDAPGLELPPGPRVVAMGRLAEQKGFDILLKAFAQLKDRHPDWSLVLLGEGELRRPLELLRDSLGLTDRVRLAGRVEGPEAVLARSDLFVLSSRFEGFPMALCEAMAAGLPVISTDCPTGPREIVRPGLDGILVPPEDPAALAAAMDRLMTDSGERRRLASRAPEIIERFDLKKIMDSWEKVLLAVGAANRFRLAGPAQSNNPSEL